MNRVNGGGRNSGADHTMNGRRPGENHVREAWHFLRRNLRLVLGVPLVTLLVAIAALQVVRPVYNTGTTLRIDEERSSVPVLDALRSISSGSEVTTEIQVLGSRTLAEEVIDSLGLQVRLQAPRGVSREDILSAVQVRREAPPAKVRFRRQSDGTFLMRGRGVETRRVAVGEPVRLSGALLTLGARAADHDRITVRVHRYDDVLRSFRRTLSVGRPVRDADIVHIGYSGSDRQLATAVPNVLADRFIRLRAMERGSESRSTITFLDEQLGIVREELNAAESDLQHFREQAGVISLEAEARAHVTGLGELKAQRDALAAEASAFEALLRRVALSDPETEPYAPRALLAFPSLFRVPAVSALLTSLSEAEGQRLRMLERVQPDEPEVLRLAQRIRDLEEQITAITRSYLESMRQQVASLDRTLAQFREDLQSVPAREISYFRLLRETSGLSEIYGLLQMRLKEQEVAAAVWDNSVRVVDPAVIPPRPSFPNVPLTLVLSLMVGSVLGLGVAFLRDQMDTAVHTRDDLAAATSGASVLGIIPRIHAARANGRGDGTAVPPGVDRERLVSAEPHHVAAEAFRALRTSIAFSRAGSPPRLLVITSPTPGDGKSTTSANLALTLAQQGHRCILVDADLRRGALNELLGHAREPGLSNLLLGGATLEEAVKRRDIEGVELELIPTGVLPPNPAELLGSDAMRALLERLGEAYDFVVMDAPPLNLVTDAALLGSMADGVILVARAGVTDRDALEYSAERLAAVRAPLLGTVLNDAGQGRERYYGSYTPEVERYVNA
jgi:capsular exopolysaccharide synthesis family protein